MALLPSVSDCRYRPTSQRQLASSVVAGSDVVECSGHSRQAPWSDARVALDHVPRAQGIAPPALHQKPALQSLHSLARRKPVELPTVPAVHGVGAELPLAHHDLRGHSAHTVAPFAPWNVPAAQRSHVAMPSAAAKLPGAQRAGSVAPAGVAEPVGHILHSSAFASPLALLKRPAGHRSAALLPSGQYTPGPHGLQLVAPPASCKVPSGHSLQLVQLAFSGL